MKKRSPIFSKPSKKFSTLFDAKVKESNSIVVTSHISPDDDSISSMLTIYRYMTRVLQVSPSRVKMLCTGEKSTVWNNFADYKHVNFVADVANELENVDLLIILDGSGWDRFTNSSARPTGFDGYTICVDHHPNPSDKFDLHLVDANSVSTVDMIYRLFFMNVKLDKELAELFFIGIWGDTGGFCYVKPENSYVFEIAKRLVDEGKIDIQLLVSSYRRTTEEVFKLIGLLIENTQILKINNWPPAQVSYLEREVVSVFDQNEIAYAYHFYIDTYVRFLEGADWGFVVTPRDTFCRLSFRSLPGSVNVRLLAEQFSGGGHDRASGGKVVEKDVKKSLKVVTDWMEKNEPVFE